MDNLAGVALMITALVGVCNFVLNVALTLQGRAIKAKTDKIHIKTEELATQTNSLVDKALENTDAIARAEGRAEALASLIVPVDPATTAAEVIDRAADRLADLVAKAVTPKQE